MPSPHNSYYTSLLSENYEDDLEHEDYADAEKEEVWDVSPMTGMTSESKMKGRSKNFSEDEANLLVSAWLNVGQDPVVMETNKKMQLSGEELSLIFMSTGLSSRTIVGPH
jgi:hypothetical protein